MICLVIKLLQKRFSNDLKVIRQRRQLYGTVAVLRMQSSVEIYGDRTVIAGTDLQTLVIIGHPPGAAPRHQILGKHVRA